MIEPGLYVGSVMHRRSRPVRRRFEYRVFWLILDLDRLRETASALKLMSLERFNLLSFYARDHADGRDGSLRDKIASLDDGGWLRRRRADAAHDDAAGHGLCVQPDQRLFLS